MNSRCILISSLLFVVVMAQTPQVAVAADDTRKKIESLSADQLDQLRRNQERFAKMSPSEQKRIRELHDKLNNHKDSPHLTQVMEKYTTWLRSLPAGKRAELLSASSKERLEKMREMIKSQERDQFMRLAADELKSEDRETLILWFKQLALARREELIKVMPESMRQRFDETQDEKSQSGMLVFALFSNPERLQVQADEVQQLLGSLSPKARNALGKVGTIDQKTEMISDWIGILRASQMRRGLSREPVPEAKLSEFYDGLDDGRKEYLRNLPSEQMKRALEMMYHSRNWSRRGGGRGFRQGPGGGRSGGRGGFGGRREEGGNGREPKSPPPRKPRSEPRTEPPK